ncbi:MAG: acyl carrier protein [Lachnospiraceae bacterium]|nr:acyl carrier protein [Lachnospiraceae bacterium]MBR3683759.1 acyl carrier protein [Lachnospiraceae bacterium]
MEFDKLKQIIASVLSVDPNEVKVETTFLEELGADSLDVYQMVLAIENEFDIELKEEDVEKISTVGEALDLIKNSRNE